MPSIGYEKQVISFVANDAYLPQVKSLMVNCRRHGNWKGDFCLVLANDCNPSDLEERGIFVMRTSDDKWSMFTKFWIFANYFKRWQKVLCLDCDSLIQGDLNEVFDGLTRQLPSILFDSGGDKSILYNWEHFDSLHGSGPESHPELYERMRVRFPHINEIVLTADVIFFDPSTISKGTVETLQSVAEDFKEANAGCIDQPVYNLVLYDKMAPITKDFCTWFAHDDPASRIPCLTRGWRGDEAPAILHYWNMFAPWIVKTPDAQGYYNHRLERVCHELYAENLAAFEEVFPLKT